MNVKEPKSKERYLFLFKSRILVCKVRRISESRSIFVLLEILKLPDLEVRDNNIEKNKLEVYSKGELLQSFQAHTEEIKQLWLQEIRNHEKDPIALQEHIADDLKVDPTQVHLDEDNPLLKLPHRVDSYIDSGIKPSDYAKDYLITKTKGEGHSAEFVSQETVSKATKYLQRGFALETHEGEENLTNQEIKSAEKVEIRQETSKSVTSSQKVVVQEERVVGSHKSATHSTREEKREVVQQQKAPSPAPELRSIESKPLDPVTEVKLKPSNKPEKKPNPKLESKENPVEKDKTKEIIENQNTKEKSNPVPEVQKNPDSKTKEDLNTGSETKSNPEVRKSPEPERKSDPGTEETLKAIKSNPETNSENNQTLVKVTDQHYNPADKLYSAERRLQITPFFEIIDRRDDRFKSAYTLPDFFDPPPTITYETHLEISVKKEYIPPPPPPPPPVLPRISHKLLVNTASLERRTKAFLEGDYEYEERRMQQNLHSIHDKLKTIRSTIVKSNDTSFHVEDTVKKAESGDFSHIFRPYGLPVKEPVYKIVEIVEPPNESGACAEGSKVREEETRHRVKMDESSYSSKYSSRSSRSSSRKVECE